VHSFSFIALQLLHQRSCLTLIIILIPLVLQASPFGPVRNTRRCAL
jgi:hypothetical protein